MLTLFEHLQSKCCFMRAAARNADYTTFFDRLRAAIAALRLSRNYSFADKQERTVGRSKVVRKFLYRNFLPPEVQKGRYPCAASRPRCADTCSPFLSICRANAISCALPREMLKNADYTTFSTDRKNRYHKVSVLSVYSDSFALRTAVAS